MNKTALTVITFISILFYSFSLSAQSDIEINDVNYKFKFSLPSGWNQKNAEETPKNDAISYSFDRKDGKMGIMLLAFKVSEVKNLNDFVYTLEKDLTLNIPKIDGDYTDFDSGNYDGKTARYKDTEFTEVIYFYRTKIIDGANYTYLLRFIMPSTFYNSTIESEIKGIAEKFALVLE
ncbi:MAG TPA: hypothetical protein PKD83_09370 [Ignavibacteria bacterium]|nr:hypothetical protein [Ignavibacteria bacterium]